MGANMKNQVNEIHAVVSPAVHALLGLGLNARQVAAVLVSSAHSLLEADDPIQSKGLLLLLAGRITGTAQEVRRND
jgi:hypothetical protein